MSADSPLDPDLIARKTFLAGFRGYEQQEVRAYLHDLSQDVRRLQSRLFAAESRVAELEPLAAERSAPINPAELSKLVGEETARVLDAAQAAADEITSKAEQAAERVVAEATAEAHELRQEADEAAADVRAEAATVLDTRRAEADEAAAEILSRAERDAATMRSDADADHERMLAEAQRVSDDAAVEAERLIEAAKAEGRSMVIEAQALRERILKDLGRRRHSAKAQVERLNAGRERLLAAYETVRGTLDEATSELTSVVGEARAAADSAALRMQDEEIATVAELEAELTAAIDSGLPIVDIDGGDPLADEHIDGLVDHAPAEIEVDGEAEVESETADLPSEPTDDADDAARGGPVAVGLARTVTTDELPTIDPDAFEAGPVEDPPQPIVMPRRNPKRRLLRRDAPTESTLLPPAELVPLTERHAIEGVRIVGPTASEAVEQSQEHSPSETPDVETSLDESTPVEPSPEARTDASQGDDEVIPEAEADVADEASTDTAESADVDETDPLSLPLGDEEIPDGAEIAMVASDAVRDDDVDNTLEGPARVDALFARIRAERSDALERAERVLADVDEDVAAEVDDQPEPEPEAVAEAEAEAVEAVVDDGDDRSVALRAVGEREEALTPLTKELSKRLKRALADEQNELLDALRRAEHDDVLAHLPHVNLHASSYRSAAGSVLFAAAAAGAALNDSTDVPDVDHIGHAMAEAIVRPLRDRFGKAREESAGDVDELDTRLRACYREWKSTVLMQVGSDALVAAYSAGVVASTASGCSLRWLVSPNGAPCPDADDNALEGPIAAGSEFPTGDLAPPAHPGCRCVLVTAG